MHLARPCGPSSGRRARAASATGVVVSLRLAAFADEISPDLDVQIEHCRKNGVTHFELRGVAGKNVLDFDDSLRAEIKRKLADAGMGVISIGSPIGKVKLSEPWEKHFDRFKVA